MKEDKEKLEKYTAMFMVAILPNFSETMIKDKPDIIALRARNLAWALLQELKN